MENWPFKCPQPRVGSNLGAPEWRWLVVPASDSGSGRGGARTPEELRSQLGFLEDEVNELRRRLVESPVHSRGVEQRLAETQRSLAAVTSQNERLAQTLREARDQIMTLKE